MKGNHKTRLFQKTSMKKNIIILFLICSIVSYSQEIVLPENILQIYKLRGEANEAFDKVRKDINSIPHAIEKYENLFMFSNIDESTRFIDYADLIAQSGDLHKAIQYYEYAFSLKKMTVRQFSYPFRKRYFEKDTLLYNEKQKEFIEKSANYYSARDLELLGDMKAMLAVDQFARYYDQDYPKHKEYSRNIIAYADSIIMIRWIELFEKYPEYDHPLSIDNEIALVLGRHIFTSYPEFWLTYEEPRTRKSIIEGKGYPKGYARTYDRAMITSGRETFSFYGEWDNDGKNVNPDKELVNKRRANLGLLPLEEKKDNPMEFFITY